MTRNTKLLFAFTICLSIIPLFPVVVLFYHNQIGLSFHQFMIGEIIFSAIVVLMEVPSGWISDIWKRKYVLALGAALSGAGYVALALAGSFWDAVAGQALIGFGVSFVSGTIGALLYDDLLHHGKEEDFRRLEGKRHGTGLYVVGISSVAGGFLYVFDPYLPVWICALANFLCVPVALIMDEPPRVKKVVEGHPLKDMAQVVLFSIRDNKELAALILFVAILYGGTQAGMWMQQPYYIALNIPEEWFGVFAAVGFLIGGTGGYFGHLLERWFRPVHILTGLWLIVIAFWALSGAALWYHGLALMMISTAAFGIGWPVVQDAANKRIDSSRRATVLSSASTPAAERRFFQLYP